MAVYDPAINAFPFHLWMLQSGACQPSIARNVYYVVLTVNTAQDCKTKQYQPALAISYM